MGNTNEEKYKSVALDLLEKWIDIDCISNHWNYNFGLWIKLDRDLRNY